MIYIHVRVTCDLGFYRWGFCHVVRALFYTVTPEKEMLMDKNLDSLSRYLL